MKTTKILNVSGAHNMDIGIARHSKNKVAIVKLYHRHDFTIVECIINFRFVLVPVVLLSILYTLLGTIEQTIDVVLLNTINRHFS